MFVYMYFKETVYCSVAVSLVSLYLLFLVILCFFNFCLLFILICLPLTHFFFLLYSCFILKVTLTFFPSSHRRWFRVIGTNDPYNCTEDQWHQYCFFYWHRVRFIVILWVTVLCVWLFIYFRLYCPEHYPSTCQVRIISQTFPNNLLIVKMLWGFFFR